MRNRDNRFNAKKERIMKNSLFRRSATVLTAIAVAFCAFAYSSSGIVSADEQDDLEQQIEESKQRQKELDKKIKETSGDISKEKENQEAIDEQIETVEDYLAALREQIGDYGDQIEALEDEIEILNAEIAIQEKKISDKGAEVDDISYRYGQSLRSIYLGGNNSVASIILGSQDFFDMLMRMEFVKRIANYNDELIQSLNDTIAELEAAELELENEEAAKEETVELTEQKKTEVEAKKAEWDGKLEELQDLYAQSKSTQRRLEQEKKELEADQKKAKEEQEKFAKELEEVIRAKQRKEYMGDLPQGTFLWPCPGNYNITSPYGSRWGTTHKGIDIGASKGDDITAANSGVVITVYNGCSHNYGKDKFCGCGGGFGNYCIIDHGGGYATLYGHATKITVKEGQTVKTGDVIGYVGSTGNSTGWHLHFEVRVDGVRKNPESFDLKKY